MDPEAQGQGDQELQEGEEEKVDEKKEAPPEVGNFFTYWGKFRDYFREALAEWFGVSKYNSLNDSSTC